MRDVPAIIEALGGYKAVAAGIGAPDTTVHSWIRKGHVPPWRIPALVAFAATSKVKLSPRDFPPARRVQQDAAA